MSTPTRLPTVFISHGGGPWPWMAEAKPAYAQLAHELATLPRRWPQATRMLMISAHWEAPHFTLQGAAQPGMLFDYYGFPPETYQVKYPAAGDPALAARVVDLLQAAHLPAAVDAERGFDHGMFSPMAVMYPKADLPTVQLSLRRGLAPAEHLALGRALAPLRDEGVIIVGSGLSYHNLRAWGPYGQAPSAAFDRWLEDTMALHGQARSERLLHWEHAPAARQAHPREEHLLPLMVAVGAAEDEAATRTYHQRDFMGGLTVSNFVFGLPTDGSEAP